MSAVPFTSADETKLDGIEALADVTDDASVRAALAAATADIAVNAQKITGLGAPTAGTDAATKDYADALANGLDWKEACRVATTANITLSGEQTIDGVLTSADRILVKDQTTASENGIYVTAAGAWSRAADADSDAEVTAGLSVMIAEGTANGDKKFVLTTNDPIVVDTTALTFTVQSAGLADDEVTNAKLANMAQATIKGRADGAGTGDPVDLTAAQARTILNVGDGADVVGPGSSTDNAFARFDSTTGKVLQNSTGATLSDTGGADFAALQARALAAPVSKTDDFTFELDHAGILIEASNAAAKAATIPPNSSVAFPLNTILSLKQTGAGAFTWTEGAGVTITPENGLTAVTNGQPSYSHAQKTGTDAWTVFGNLVPEDAAVSFQKDFAISDSLGTPLAVAADVGSSWIAREAYEILDAHANMKNAGSGTGNNVFDIHLNGTTIMTTNKINIQPAETDSEDATTQPALTTTSCVAGDVFSFHIDGVHSTTTGDGAVVSLVLRKA